MIKKYTKEEYDVSDLFNLSKGNLCSAEILFCQEKPEIYINTLYSAGYLCHLGIELLLKGCWLYEKEYFYNYHSLKKIINEIEFLNELYEQNENTISNLEEFYNMRYPPVLSADQLKEEQKADITNNLGGEIGDSDWINTIKLLHEIQSKMPSNLASIAKPIYKIFANTLNEQRYLKGGKLYKLYRYK